MKADLSKVTKAYIDVCTVCNHTCVFCPNQDKRTPKSILSADDFRSILSNINTNTKIKELSLSAKGEPLLNPQLKDIVAIAKTEFAIPYVYMSTNGSLLDKSTLTSLLKSGLDSIKFSINAFTQEEYLKVHGKDHYEQVMKNLADAIGLFSKFDFKLLTSSITDLNENQIRNTLRHHIGDGVDSIDYILRYKQSFRPIDENKPEEGLDYPPCPYLFNEIYVDSSGALQACCVDYFNELTFGNMKTTPLAEAWDSPKFNALRKQHINKTLPSSHLCYQCLTHGQDMFDNEEYVEKMLKDKQNH